MMELRLSRKGISLPVEMIVIIAIAVLVLVVVAAYFMIFPQTAQTISDNQALQSGCQTWKQRGCSKTETNFDIPNYKIASIQGKMLDACNRVLSLQETTLGSRCWNYCCGTGTAEVPA